MRHRVCVCVCVGETVTSLHCFVFRSRFFSTKGAGTKTEDDPLNRNCNQGCSRLFVLSFSWPLCLCGAAAIIALSFALFLPSFSFLSPAVFQEISVCDSSYCCYDFCQHKHVALFLSAQSAAIFARPAPPSRCPCSAGHCFHRNDVCVGLQRRDLVRHKNLLPQPTATTTTASRVTHQ